MSDVVQVQGDESEFVDTKKRKVEGICGDNSDSDVVSVEERNTQDCFLHGIIKTDNGINLYKEEYIRLIIQSLKHLGFQLSVICCYSNCEIHLFYILGYSSSAEILASESGLMRSHFMIDTNSFKDMILNGNFDEALLLLQNGGVFSFDDMWPKYLLKKVIYKLYKNS
jgi:hypothetical protein